MRKKFWKAVRKIFDNIWLRMIFFVACIIGIFALSGAFSSADNVGQKIKDLILSEDFLSIFLAAIFSMLVANLVFLSRKYTEESLKIDDDHHKIICKYSGHEKKDYDSFNNLYEKNGVFAYLTRVPKERKEIKNPVRDKFSSAYKERQSDIDAYVTGGKLYLPIVSVFTNADGKTKVKFSDSSKAFRLPEFVMENMLKLMEAHKTSRMSNNITIRLNDIEYENGVLTLETMRSQYFDMLITNRCMDFCLDDSVTMRDFYEFDKRVSTLNDSKLGNQIGINGLIVTNDGYLLVEKRGMKKTTWKDKFAQPISLAMKLNDTDLKPDEEFGDTPEAAEAVFKKIVTSTVKKNFGLDEELVDFSMSQNFLGIARDLLEGGKPNMYFYVAVDKSAKELDEILENKFKKACGRLENENNEALPQVTSDKLDSDYYLIDFKKITIDYNYRLKIKARDIIRVKRKYAPRVSGFAEKREGFGYRARNLFNANLSKECGDAFLTCLYYADVCSKRIKELKRPD